MRASNYRKAVLATVPADDPIRDVYPLCASDLEVVFYTHCRQLMRVDTFFEWSITLWQGIGRQLPVNLAPMTEPARALWDAVMRLHRGMRELERIMPNLTSEHLYDQAETQKATISEDFDSYAEVLCDCILYSLTAQLAPATADVWQQEYRALPQAVADEKLNKLNMVLEELEELVSMVWDQIRHPEVYEADFEGWAAV